MFIRDRVASVARPVLELKGVRKLALAANASARAAWSLPVAALAFVGLDLERVVEPGAFEIHVGQSADPAGFLTATVEVDALRTCRAKFTEFFFPEGRRAIRSCYDFTPGGRLEGGYAR